MNYSQPWFPNFGLLKIFYKKRGCVHGIDHILRVWVYTILIAKEIGGEFDINILSAAALFHDIGRRSDFTDRKHGERSSEWVKNFLQTIAPNYSQNQVDQIALLCAHHNLPDGVNESLELQILKDADALDRERISPNNLKEEYLRLEVSRKLLPFCRIFTKEWKYLARKEKDPQVIFHLQTRKYHICALKHELKKPMNSRESVEQLQRTLLQVQRKMKRIASNINRNGTTEKLLKDLEEILQKFPSDNNSFLHAVIRNEIYHELRLVLFRELSNYTYDEKLSREILKSYNGIKTAQMSEGEIKSSIFSILPELTSPNRRLVFESSLRTALYNGDEQTAQLLTMIRNGHSKDLFQNLIKPISVVEDAPINFPRRDVQEQPDLWLLINRKWIETAISFAEKGQKTKALIILEYVSAFLKIMLNTIPINLEQNQKVFEILNNVIFTAKRFDLNLNYNKISSILGSDYFMFKVVKFPKTDVAYYANLFNIYDRDSKSLINALISQLRFLEGLSRKVEIEEIFQYYIKPIFIAFKINIADIPNELLNVRALIRKNIDLKLLTTATGNDYMTLTIDKKSKENCTKLEVQEERFLLDEEPKIVMNIVNLKTLSHIIESDGKILSSWNRRKTQSANFFKRIKSSETTETARDIVQRSMCIRQPNISDKHPLYASLELETDLNIKRSLSNILNFRKLNLSIPRKFKEKAYGNVILVFKDDLKKRSIFTYFDSCWKHRNKPVSYSVARQLFQKIKREPIRESLKNHPLSYPTAYIEAIILGGEITLNDVDMIILPRNEALRNRKAIVLLTEKHPAIKIVRV